MKHSGLFFMIAVVGSVCASGNARATIGLPDSESCNSSSNYCLAITQNSGSLAAISGFGPTGVVGQTETASGAGVYGQANTSGIGVKGLSQSGYGVSGVSTLGGGVYAASSSGIGITATSSTSNGIYASSNSADTVVSDAGNCSGCSAFYGRANAGNSGSFAFYGRGNLKLVAGNGQTGDAYKPTGINWVNTSDARLKKDITDFTTGLSQLSKVHPVKFKFNGLADTDNDGREHVGVLAQELEKVFPSMVSSRRTKLHPSDANETDIKQVDANDFTFMLINSVKELSTQNDLLRKRVKALEEKQPSYAAGLGGNGMLGLGLGLLGCTLMVLRRRATNP